ncbi:hypothetical protein AVEN_234487-1 [Araneus ventricosus]|uniref:Uncharacterized protein n=1 Tax=Araneus ventricosus TaxID=182803 RepID=A0A4Y2AA73_ARAVE|nr:hypothetical protein AVEN_234487-1 [Araneus ventricosus]
MPRQPFTLAKSLMTITVKKLTVFPGGATYPCYATAFQHFGREWMASVEATLLLADLVSHSILQVLATGETADLSPTFPRGRRYGSHMRRYRGRSKDVSGLPIEIFLAGRDLLCYI